MTTTFQDVSRNNDAHLLIYYTAKFINRYMAEGILCNCLEATSRLQSRLQYSTKCVHTHAHVIVMPLHKPCTQHNLHHYKQQFGLYHN